MGTFDNLPEALDYAVHALAARRHAYIINVRGPKELEQSRAATIQVVPSTYVYNDGDLGLAVHMPFDPSSGTFKELTEFLDTEGHDTFDEYRIDGILAFVMNFGQNVTRATKVLEYLLERVYEYPAGTAFQCEVYDQGLAENGD
jgi:hypothetical protein